MARLYGYCRKSTEEQNETSFEIKEKKSKKIFKIDIDNIILSMILYGCKRERDTFLPKKRINKGEIRNEKENRKSYYRGYRVY